MYRDLEKFNRLASFGRELLHRPSIAEGLPMIAEYAVELLDCDRCSVFVYDEKRNRLWTEISDGVDRIDIDADKGLAGAALKSKDAIVVNSPYEDRRFLQKIDEETGYLTQNILALVVFDAFRHPIGVLQFLNKKNEVEFNDKDVELATFFNHYISTYLQMAKLLEEQKNE
ncbi:MAG: GAF domain-containing protein [Sulfurovum sp.]